MNPRKKRLWIVILVGYIMLFLFVSSLFLFPRVDFAPIGSLIPRPTQTVQLPLTP